MCIVRIEKKLFFKNLLVLFQRAAKTDGKEISASTSAETQTNFKIRSAN